MNELPEVKVRKGLELKDFNLEDLKGVGAGIVSYGVNLGDVITFPAAKDLVFKGRQVNKDSGNFERMVGCERNGAPSWVSLSAFRRKDTSGNLYGEVLLDLANEYNCFDDFDRCNVLAGTTIQCTSMEKKPQKKFGSDAVEDKNYPIIEWVTRPTK